MGWIGPGLLVAAAGFLLYRHSPSTWCSTPAAAQSTTALKAEQDRPRNLDQAGETVVEDISTIRPDAELTASDENDNGDSDSLQSTPKVLAKDVIGTDDVPIILLDSGGGVQSMKTMENSPSNGTIKQSTLEMAQLPTSSSTKSSSMLMPPPPVPRRRGAPQEQLPQSETQANVSQYYGPPRAKSNAQLRPQPSAASALRVPASSRLSSTLAPKRTGERPLGSPQVTLRPGHSPLDWAALVAKPNNDLRGAGLPPDLIRVPPSMLKAHNGRNGHDAWTSFQGKIYNISPYLSFHPGGKGEIMRGAGKDSGKFFMETHPWVNWDGILGTCLVGILVSEHDSLYLESGNHLDTMD